MEYRNEFILVDKTADRVTVVTLNNPPLNLVTLGLCRELRETLSKLEQDDEVRVIVLTGSGKRAFCVGSDIKEFPEVWDDVIGKKLEQENLTFNAVELLSKPVIAAMEGNVLGGGCELSMACDIRILSESGRIGLPEINLGVFPGSGGIFRLAKLVGPAKAVEMMYTGQMLPAQEALRLGLVNRLAPEGAVCAAALELAQQIVQKPFESLRLIKRVVRELWLKPTQECFYPNLELSKTVFQTEDCAEGVDAFLNKRKPQFR